MAIRPVAMPQMGTESPTVQAMGEGRVPPGKELERQRAGGVWEEIEGILAKKDEGTSDGRGGQM